MLRVATSSPLHGSHNSLAQLASNLPEGGALVCMCQARQPYDPHSRVTGGGVPPCFQLSQRSFCHLHEQEKGWVRECESMGGDRPCGTAQSGMRAGMVVSVCRDRGSGMQGGSGGEVQGCVQGPGGGAWLYREHRLQCWRNAAAQQSSPALRSIWVPQVSPKQPRECTTPRCAAASAREEQAAAGGRGCHPGATASPAVSL